MKRILLISHDLSTEDGISQTLKGTGDGYVIHRVESSLQALDQIYSDRPDLLLVDHSMPETEWEEFRERMKADTVFGHLPIVLILDPRVKRRIPWEDLPIDDYLYRPLDSEEMVVRVSLVFARAARVQDANPLTRLPGNYSIMKKIQERIDTGGPFEVAYVDLDNFKSYNDKYGFLRGDEIIKVTARLLTNSVRKIHSLNAFVGHIGGDDFVFIVPPEKMEGVCQEVISNFDLLVGNFYDEVDRAKKSIESTNRKGEKETFPFVSVSIAVVTNAYRPIKHIGEVSAIAAEIKKLVKKMPGSNYHKDLRGSKNGQSQPNPGDG